VYDISEVTAKIRKLLALANRAGTEGEAVAAAARAQELIDKYNLSIGTEVLEEETATEKDSGGSTARMSPHLAILGRAACRLFDCDFYYYHGECLEKPDSLYRYAYRRTLRFVGLRQNVEACVLTYNYLLASVESLLSGSIKGTPGWARADYRAFRIGCARRILSMAEDVKRQTVQIGGEQSEALVRIGMDVARRHIEAMKMSVHYSNTGYGYAEEAYNIGYQEGSKVDIHGARTTRMLAGKIDAERDGVQ